MGLVGVEFVVENREEAGEREGDDGDEANVIISSRTRAICSEQQCAPNKPLRIKPFVGCDAWEKRDHVVVIEFWSSEGRPSRAYGTNKRTGRATGQTHWVGSWTYMLTCCICSRFLTSPGPPGTPFREVCLIHGSLVLGSRMSAARPIGAVRFEPVEIAR